MLDKMMVVLSGGQDSTTCLYWALQQAKNVRAVCVDYGQRHSVELQAAFVQAHLANIPLEIIKVPDVLVSTSPLVSKAPLEQYENWDKLPGGLEKTFVPMRNQLFLTLAANRALAWGCGEMVTGVCQEDYGGYPDCRRVFVLAVEAAIRLGSFVDEDQPFTIRTPLMDLSKAQSVELALSLPGCYGALGFSHTAYDGMYPPTGKDHASLLRAKGFAQALVPDPLVVRAHWESVMPLPDTENYTRYANQIRAHAVTRADAHAAGVEDSLSYATFMANRLNNLRAEF